MAAEKSQVFAWIVENVVECDKSQYVDLSQIKKKSEMENITSAAVGNVMKKLFKNIEIKSVRSKDNWCQRTQRYYGCTWKETHTFENNIEFNDVPTVIPENYFVISKTPFSIQIGHFTGEIVNGNKVLIEIELKVTGELSVSIMGTILDLENIGVKRHLKSITTDSIKTIFEFVNNFRFCNGVKNVENINSPSYEENVCQQGNENSMEVRFRSKTCQKVLPFTTSNVVSSVCKNCKKLKVKPVKSVNITETELSEKENEITLCESNNEDMTEILNRIFPECPVKMRTFLLNQKMALERNPHGRRWDKDVIRVCLTLYCRSPRGYSELKNSNFLILPSQNLLRRYKNSIHQEAGIKTDMLDWMSSEADLKNVPPEGRQGGLVIDEMSIQPDLQFRKHNGSVELIGFTECTPESIVLEQIKSGKEERILATHVLQLVFLGFTGYRFPFAHFPSHTASGHELYLLVWKSVNMLSSFGFTIQYISTDGAQSNRDLFKILLPDFKTSNPTTCAFRNIFSPKSHEMLFFIMDISHTVKKIRNNVSKSGDSEFCKRRLKHKDKFIEWSHFRQAYLWDISKNPFPVHHRLTQEHIFLTSENKMRNHLAEEVLNSDMLHLMKLYKESLGEAGNKLDATIQLLENTSVLIKNFKDSRPITDSSDERLKENHDVLQWFVEWENMIKSDKEISNKETHLISHQTREDIISSIMGFEEMCYYKFKSSNSSIIPSRVNSDVIENMFCQQRTLHNGANTNPTYLGYCNAVNSVILGQASISRKSNTGGKGAAVYETEKQMNKVKKHHAFKENVEILL